MADLEAGAILIYRVTLQPNLAVIPLYWQGTGQYGFIDKLPLFNIF